MLSKIRKDLIGLCGLLVFVGACSDERSVDPRTQSAPLQAGASEVTGDGMQPLDHATWVSTRLSYVPDIVVVDLWASWCVPCLERFPAMVALHHKYSSRGVQFVSLSLDDRSSPADLDFARDFIAKQSAPFPHFLLDEEILDGFDKIGIRGVPAVDIYARDGKRAYRLTGDDPNDQYDEADVERAIVELLDQTGHWTREP